VQTAVDRLRRRLGPGERRTGLPAYVDGAVAESPEVRGSLGGVGPAERGPDELDTILREIDEIEALVRRPGGGGPAIPAPEARRAPRSS
jgi:hypothetical protein